MGGRSGATPPSGRPSACAVAHPICEIQDYALGIAVGIVLMLVDLWHSLRSRQK
jgi:hypothetical protein